MGRALTWLLGACSLLLGASFWVAAPVMPSFLYWSGVLCLVLMALAALASLARYLPWQNVIVSAGLIVLLSGVGEPGNTASRAVWARGGDDRLWGEPLAWLVAIVTARGLGRLILRPWLQTPTYGFRLLAASVLLVVLVDAGFGVLAVNANGAWHWRLGASWPIPAWSHAAGVAMFSLFLLVAAAPWLIDKRPEIPPPDRQPLVIWAFLAFLVIASAAVNGHWLTAASACLAGTGPWLAMSAFRPLSLFPSSSAAKKGG